MNKYLKFAIVTACISILVAGGILSFAIKELKNIGIGGTAAEHIGAITNISMAVSAVFGLIIGSIAIIAVIEAEKSEVKAIESFKLDLVGLVNTLYGLRMRCLLYTAPDQVDYALDVFRVEKEKLQSFMYGSSGYALNLWALDTKAIADLEPNTQLSSLLNWMTLGMSQKPQVALNQIMFRSQDMLHQLTRINDGHLKQIHRNIKRVGRGLDEVRALLEHDTFFQFIEDFKKDGEARASNLVMPTEAELDAVLKRADEKIGGKSRETIMHFINEARAGKNESLATYYELVRQLKLDE